MPSNIRPITNFLGLSFTEIKLEESSRHWAQEFTVLDKVAVLSDHINDVGQVLHTVPSQILSRINGFKKTENRI